MSKELTLITLNEREMRAVECLFQVKVRRHRKLILIHCGKCNIEMECNGSNHKFCSSCARDRNLERLRRRREKYRELYREKDRIRRQQHPDVLMANQRRYREKNRDVIRERNVHYKRKSRQEAVLKAILVGGL